MNLELAEALPKCLQDSLLCYTFVDSRVTDSAPNITTCNVNGYIYEVRNKKIVSSLDIDGERASCISSYHLWDSEKFVTFYLIFTLTNKLLFVKRTNNGLQKIIFYENVKDFEVYDFKNVGYPVVKIFSLIDSNNEVVEFPTQVERLQETNLKLCHAEEYNRNISNIANALSEKLQMVNMHVDQLSEEQIQIKKVISAYNAAKNNVSRNVLAGLVKFSSVVNKNYELEIAVVASWYKIFGNFLILGLKINNGRKGHVTDIKLIINHEKIQTFTHSFFGYSNGSILPFHVQPSLKPDEEITVVGTFQIPSVMIDSKLSFSYCLITSSWNELLLQDTFYLDVLEAVTQRTFPFDKELTVEDLMGVMAIKRETKIEIDSEVQNQKAIETILVKNLDFKKIEHMTDKFFYCTSTFLREVFIIMKQVSISPKVWNLYLYTSDDAQIYFLVNALYDLLPEKTTILCDI